MADESTDVNQLLQDWATACRQALATWGTTQQEVAEHSESFRKRRVAGNEVRGEHDEPTACWACYIKACAISLHSLGVQEAFIQNNKLYAGISDAVNLCQYPWYVITSRAKDRTLKLLKGLLSQDWPEDTPRLYAGLSPPNEMKIAAIR